MRSLPCCRASGWAVTVRQSRSRRESRQNKRMRHLMPAVVCCLLALSSMTVTLAGPALVVKQFGQRLSDRYTVRDGLPAGRILRIEVEGKAVRARGEGGSAVFADGK